MMCIWLHIHYHPVNWGSGILWKHAWSFPLLLLLPVCIGSMLVWMLCELLILVDVEMYSSCCCCKYCPIVCSWVGWWDNLWYYLSLFEPITVVPYSVWMPMIIFCGPAPRTLVCNFLLISPLVLVLQITVAGCHYGWCLLDCFLSHLWYLQLLLILWSVFFLFGLFACLPILFVSSNFC